MPRRDRKPKRESSRGGGGRGDKRKTIMKTYTYTILIHPAEADERGYWAEVPALPGCFTQGETVDECLARAQEAVTGHLESLAKVGEPIPEEPQREDAAVVSRVRVNLHVRA